MTLRLKIPDRVADRLARLADWLDSISAASCVTEHDGQDSSEYGRVVVPAHAIGCATRIVVCVSKAVVDILIEPEHATIRATFVDSAQ